jgi:hypothetical protein
MLPRSASVSVTGPERTHHQHHGIARRDFVLGTAGLTGAAVGGSWLGGATTAAADSSHRLSTAAPRPIPGGFQLEPGGEVFHVILPGQGEPNTITDFKGTVGVAVIDGRGTGANASRAFEVDIRFMEGTFVGLDGKRNFGTFGFF